MKKVYLVLCFLAVVCLSNLSFGQVFYPGGDTCTLAVPIGIGDDYYTIDDGPGDDHWYKFIAPCDGNLRIVDSGPYESERRIYSGVCGSLTIEASETWVTSVVETPVLAGEEFYLVVNDSWSDQAQFNIEMDGCDDMDSVLLDVQGTVYYDVNDNGEQDPGELGRFLTPMVSDPDGIYSVTAVDGHYFSPVTDLPDGLYELSPNINDHWRISSDSLFYSININDDYEQRDSLDFGIHPDTLIYEVDADLIDTWTRCNDTVNYYIYKRNTGTTIAEGRIHLEIDDSLYYVSADIAPDSVVGKNIYWTYENLYFDEHEYLPFNSERQMVLRIPLTVSSR